MIGLPADVRRAVHAASRRLSGEYDEDEWGLDPEFVAAVEPVLDLLYTRWWRVRAHGADNVPAEGPALVVANHGGVLPWDAAMIATALRRTAAVPRHPRFLVLDWAFDLPWLSVAVRKLGGVPDSAPNAARLLGQGHVVVVFPEGPRSASKDWSSRYRLERFDDWFVELALRAGVPIVPCAVVGSEEIYPRAAGVPGLGRLLGAPAPVGLVPLPSRWRIELGEPLDLRRHGPDAADDRALVLGLSEQVRELIQSKVHENLIAREGAFL